ncbi:MAG: methionine--tRNA ligase, partial [Polyangiaceae bacterium]|nr:methionine--tRNA ligase [Polyangiaceae bacterium]
MGHAYSTIVADALARYHRMRGHDTRFLTGTDEHGQKIQQAAEKQGRSPQAHVDALAEEFRQLWPRLNVEPDDFIRTTDARHVARVQELWRRVAASGDIYLGHYEGWYCVSDEAFYTEKELIDGTDEAGKPVKLSPSKRPVEWVREEGYFFRLSRYQERLLKFYEENPSFVQPEGRFNEVKRFVEAGLTDLSVSRSSFSWGIPVPGDPKHVVYVWFDALTNYWSALGGDDDPRQRFWPCDVHIVGKEISRFHAVYWPAFLMAAGLPLPRQVYAHGWLTVNGEKMSKSANNFLPPLPIAETEGVGADALRYYLLRAVALGQDGDFSHKDLLARINSELGNDLGNLLNRTLGLCSKAGLTEVPPFAPGGELEAALRGDAEAAARKAAEAMDAVAPHRALEAIWAFCRAANVYVDKAAPWKAQKDGDTGRLAVILGTLLSACRALALLIGPFLPQKAAEMRVQLGMAPLQPQLDLDQWPLAWSHLQGTLGEARPLFPRLDEPRQKQILESLIPRPIQETPPVEEQKTEAPRTETPPALPPIDYEKFSEVDLRVGLVVSAERVPRKDKLLDLRVDVG